MEVNIQQAADETNGWSPGVLVDVNKVIDTGLDPFTALTANTLWAKKQECMELH